MVDPSPLACLFNSTVNAMPEHVTNGAAWRTPYLLFVFLVLPFICLFFLFISPALAPSEKRSEAELRDAIESRVALAVRQDQQLRKALSPFFKVLVAEVPPHQHSKVCTLPIVYMLTSREYLLWGLVHRDTYYCPIGTMRCAFWQTYPVKRVYLFFVPSVFRTRIFVVVSPLFSLLRGSTASLSTQHNMRLPLFFSAFALSSHPHSILSRHLSLWLSPSSRCGAPRMRYFPLLRRETAWPCTEPTQPSEPTQHACLSHTQAPLTNLSVTRSCSWRAIQPPPFMKPLPLRYIFRVPFVLSFVLPCRTLVIRLRFFSCVVFLVASSSCMYVHSFYLVMSRIPVARHAHAPR